MEVSGNPSPNRIRTIREAAMIQTASSLQRLAVIESDTLKARNAKRTAMKAKREINSPAQVNGEIFERIGC
jgi:hypothetical protein